MKTFPIVLGATVVLLLATGGAPVAEERVARHAGQIQSVHPSDGTLIIEELGVNGVAQLVEVNIHGAAVVRIWRDPLTPWEWRERRTSIYRWPAGTYVVVIGSKSSSGAIDARRIEIPRITSESLRTPEMKP